MYEIEYELVAATNYKDSFELNQRTVRRVGWESTEHAQPPIELLVRLPRRAYVLKVQLKARTNKRVPLLELLTADHDNEQFTNAVFTSVSKGKRQNNAVYNVTENECTVNVSRCCRFIKLIILEKDQRTQASIDVLRVIGDESLASPRKPVLNNENQVSNINQQRTDKLLIELGTRLDTPELFDDLSILPVDEETKITLRDMLKIESESLRESNYSKAQQVNNDLISVLQVGKDILSAKQKMEWALARDDFKQAKSWDEQLRLLKRRRDRYDELYETTRFDQMIEFADEGSHHDKKFNELLEADKKELEAFRLREESDVQQKRALIDKEYEKAKEENEPWWEKDIPTNRSMEGDAEEEKEHIADQPPPVEEPKEKEKSPEQSPRSIPRSVQKSRQLNRGNKSPPPEEDKGEEGYDFSNPFVFNQGDADLERFINPLLSKAKLNPDIEVLRHYQQLEFLNVLGSRAWLAITSDNWRQRQAAAQSVLSFIENGIPQKYRNGKSKLLFLALMQFARLCCNDKILQIYYDGLKILGTSLAPPICGPDVSPAMINKAIKDFVPILMEKVAEMNSRAKEISLETLVSIFNHPAADIQILTKEVLRIFRQDQVGKVITADKQQARVVTARIEICIQILEKIDLTKHKFNIKEIFDLLAVPSLFHTSYEVRMGAVELIGNLFRHLGESIIVMINDISGLKSNLREMINSKLDEVREQMRSGKPPPTHPKK